MSNSQLKRHDPARIQQYPVSSANWQPPPIDATVTHEYRVVVEDNRRFNRALAFVFIAAILVIIAIILFEVGYQAGFSDALKAMGQAAK